MFGLYLFSEMLKTISVIFDTDEAALRLLFSILAGYPIAVFFRKFIYGRNRNLQHLYFIATGFLLGYLNYGLDVVHPFTAMIVTYIIMAVMGGTEVAVAAIFIFNMLYLLIGYYVMSTDSYDINWTMPQCVLVLRLIGISFDYFDGQQIEESLGADNKKYMLKQLPSLFEFLGFASFPSSFMVGPQFPLRRYQSYVNGEFGSPDIPNKPPESESAAFKRFSLGILYLVFFVVLGIFVSDALLITEDFRKYSFLRRNLLLGLWGRYTLYRYISCWLLAEGACILFGITYTGTNENGEKQWNGVENVKLSLIENTTEFNHYIQSFNINTNHWVAHYIYKRLKFLGNRNLSQAGALFFLAIWHGYHSGYFVTFLIEFLVIYLERDIKSIVNSNRTLSEFFDRAIVDIVLKLILRIYTFVFMGFCLIPFALLTFDKYWFALGSMNYSGLIIFGLYPILWGPILRAALKERRRD